MMADVRQRPSTDGRASVEGRTFDRLNPESLLAFVDRSVSEGTRRAYRCVVREFLRFIDFRHPGEVTPVDIQQWRDHLIKSRKRASTVAFKLSVIRSMFDYLKARGYVEKNPALTKLVPPLAVPEDVRGRVLTAEEARHVLAGPDRSNPSGARDYALLLFILRTSLRTAEACSLRSSSIRWSHGRWTLKVKVKGGKERTLPLPDEVRKAIDDYLKLDAPRRLKLGCGGAEAYIFQPEVNYGTLVFNKPLSPAMVWNIVRRWANWSGIGKLSPHDLRRTANTRATHQRTSKIPVRIDLGSNGYLRSGSGESTE